MSNIFEAPKTDTTTLGNLQPSEPQHSFTGKLRTRRPRNYSIKLSTSQTRLELCMEILNALSEKYYSIPVEELHSSVQSRYKSPESAPKWNTLLDQLLVQAVSLYGTSTSFIHSLFPGFKRQFVQRKIKRAKRLLSKSYIWTPKEDSILKNIFKSQHKTDLQAILSQLQNKSIQSILARVSSLNLLSQEFSTEDACQRQVDAGHNEFPKEESSRGWSTTEEGMNEEYIDTPNRESIRTREDTGLFGLFEGYLKRGLVSEKSDLSFEKRDPGLILFPADNIITSNCQLTTKNRPAHGISDPKSLIARAPSDQSPITETFYDAMRQAEGRRQTYLDNLLDFTREDGSTSHYDKSAPNSPSFIIRLGNNELTKQYLFDDSTYNH